MGEAIEELTNGFEQSVLWIDKNYIGIDVPDDDERIQISAACFDIAIECQAGMLLLLKAKNYALFFAAQRIIFEALLRGLWIQFCSTDELNNFRTGTGPKSFVKMTDLIAQNLELGEEVLQFETYRERLEGKLHDFTHTGYQHVVRRHGNETLGPNYSQKDIAIGINFAALLGMQAAARMAVIGHRPDLATATYERMAGYAALYAEVRRDLPSVDDDEPTQ